MQTALSLARLKQGDLDRDHDHDHDYDRDYNLGYGVWTRYSSILGDYRRRSDQQQYSLTPIQEADYESSTILEAAISSPHKRPRTPEPEPAPPPEAHASSTTSHYHYYRRGLCFPSAPLSTSPRQVVEALGRNEQLTSDEIALCLHFYFRQEGQYFPSDITIFDLGFPFNNTEAATPSPVIKHPERLTRRLIFIFNHEEHWTVGYLDRSQNILFHFDSAYHRTRKSLEWAKKYIPDWLTTSNIVNTPVQIREPKQQDGYNCGIFAISFAVSLAMNGEVDRIVNPSHVRDFMASMLRKEEAEPEAKTKADLSFQTTKKWHLGGDGCEGEGGMEREEPRETRRKRRRRDTSLPPELAQSLGHHHYQTYDQHQKQQQWQGDPKPTAPPRSDTSPHAYTTTTNSSGGGSGSSGHCDPADTFSPSQAVTTYTSTSTSKSAPTSIQNPSLGPAMTGTAKKYEQATKAKTTTGSAVHLANDTAPVASPHQHESSPSAAADSVQLGDLVGQLDPHLPPTLSGQALLGLVGSYFPVARAEANKHVAAAKSRQAHLQYEIGQITHEITAIAKPSESKSVTARKKLYLDGSSGDASDAHHHGRHQHREEEAEEEEDAVAIAQAQLGLSKARYRELQATMTEHKAKADELRRRVSSLRLPSATTTTTTTMTTVFPTSLPGFQGHAHNPETASFTNEDDDYDNDDDDDALEAWARDAEVLTSEISECVTRRREAHRLSAEAQAEARVWARRIDALATKNAEMDETGREIARLSWLLGWVDRLGDMCRPDQPVVLPGSGSRPGPLA
ncbi:hypothetical protein SLS53_008724 [Cytospora paraplurivora]|uniref:Ubiquitin-like protease family profile domain-containing protein n=1 Tax=Cytospora paraplurivora TaxID=2898453 RepID=A0AAN9U6I7_9PEZI